MSADPRIAKTDHEIIMKGIGIELLALGLETRKWDSSNPEARRNNVTSVRK
jgi:hypothetical protein